MNLSTQVVHRVWDANAELPDLKRSSLQASTPQKRRTIYECPLQLDQLANKLEWDLALTCSSSLGFNQRLLKDLSFAVRTLCG